MSNERKSWNIFLSKVVHVRTMKNKCIQNASIYIFFKWTFYGCAESLSVNQFLSAFKVWFTYVKFLHFCLSSSRFQTMPRQIFPLKDCDSSRT